MHWQDRFCFPYLISTYRWNGEQSQASLCLILYCIYTQQQQCFVEGRSPSLHQEETWAGCSHQTGSDQVKQLVTKTSIPQIVIYHPLVVKITRYRFSYHKNVGKLIEITRQRDLVTIKCVEVDWGKIEREGGKV